MQAYRILSGFHSHYLFLHITCPQIQHIHCFWESNKRRKEKTVLDLWLPRAGSKPNLQVAPSISCSGKNYCFNPFTAVLSATLGCSAENWSSSCCWRLDFMGGSKVFRRAKNTIQGTEIGCKKQGVASRQQNCWGKDSSISGTRRPLKKERGSLTSVQWKAIRRNPVAMKSTDSVRAA